MSAKVMCIATGDVRWTHSNGLLPASPKTLAYGLARLHSTPVGYLVRQAPDGHGWLHEIKLDVQGCMTHADNAIRAMK